MADDTSTGAPKGAHEGDSLVPEAEEIMGGAGAQAGRPADAPAADEAEALRREIEEMRQQLLRALAEAENVRRRAQRDVADARQYAVTSFARDLLNVTDNFQRALATVDGSDVDALPPEIKALVDGVRMTERELTSVFERHGITIIDPAGERFDPNRHQAMFEVERPDVPSGTVVQVVQAGSLIGDRVLRPALVGVAKGGPKPGETAAVAGDGGGDDATGAGTGSSGPEGDA